MPSNQSKITTLLEVDDPLVQDSSFRDDANYRRYVDNQILGCEQHLVESLLSGYTASWPRLSASSAAVVVGDWVCLAGENSDEVVVTKANGSAIAAAGCPYGIVIAAASPDSKVHVITDGCIPDNITGLAISSSGTAIVNSSARTQVTTPSGSDYVVGKVLNGQLTFNVFLPGGGGSFSGDALTLRGHAISIDDPVTDYVLTWYNNAWTPRELGGVNAIKLQGDDVVNGAPVTGDTLTYVSPLGWQPSPGLVVNIMHYYQNSDGEETINGHTTKNIGPAVGRAFEATVELQTHIVLWIPPSEWYGVDAWSWDQGQTLELSVAGWGLEIVGSGVASKIIPSRASGTTEKLILSGGGPQTMSCLFAYRNMFWVGDSSVGTDCISLLKTALDIQVLVENCQFYSCQGSGNGLLELNAMGLLMRRCYFHDCANAGGANAGIVTFTSGIFGAKFEQCYWYPSEHTYNPFGGAPFAKSGGYGVWARGDSLSNSPRIIFDQCIWGGNTLNGAVLANPDAGYLQSVHFFQCMMRDNCLRTIRAVANVKYIVLEDCRVQHNYGSQLTISLEDDTCERLYIDRTQFTHNQLYISANTGQKSIKITQSDGGVYDLAGAKHIEIDATSTVDGITGTASGWNRPYKLSAISTNNSTENMLDITGSEITLTNGKAYFIHLLVEGGRTDAAGNGCIEKRLKVHTTGGAVTIDDDTDMYNQLATGWGVTVSSPAGLTLRIAVDGASGQTVQFSAEAIVREVDSA